MDTTVDPTPSPMETTSLDPAGYAILCQGLTKRYGDVLALDHLDLAVPFGSIFGFLGRNGAGKTTTMRLLAGLALPTSGRAWVAGQETTGASRLARTRFGYLPQSPAFYTWMSAREYLDYIARIQGISAAERKRQVEELLALSELQNAARRKVGGFSGGMVQRLGIAQAFIGNPPVLLLDEPTSSLDPAGRYEVLDMIERLRGNTTVFLSSHILSDIERVCDTLAVLHEGRLLLVSGIEALLDRYPVDAVELELDAGNLAELEEVATQMTSALAPLPWVAKVTRQGAVIRVLVNDVPHGKQELLPLVASYRLSLNRYAWVRPSLEEIFLQISA